MAEVLKIRARADELQDETIALGNGIRRLLTEREALEAEVMRLREVVRLAYDDAPGWRYRARALLWPNDQTQEGKR